LTNLPEARTTDRPRFPGCGPSRVSGPLILEQAATLMINRRDLLRAGAVQGLAFWSAAALAQSPAKRAKKKLKAVAKPVAQADERVNRMLAPIREQHDLPGLLGAIQVGPQITAIGAVGTRKVGASEPIRVSDQVHLGSCTKAMTATLIGTLVEQRKLSWRSTIRDVFSESALGVHPQFQSVTLSQLLTHRAGLPHDAPWWRLPGESTTEKRRALLTTMLEDKPASKPGSTYAYSNVGYVLAGLMAEEVTGESWESLMSASLFEPLGMESAGFGSPGQPGTLDQPWGHRLAGKQLQPTLQDNAPAMGPAGTVHCSIADWAKFAALHLQGERGTSRLLKPATLRTLHSPPLGRDYAAGWLVSEQSWAGGHALTHNGSNTYWYATIWLAPILDVAIFVATNRGDKNAATACNAAAMELIQSLASLTQLVQRS
jgi:CubicO group peptidase (beta-lactamase class C family)